MSPWRTLPSARDLKAPASKRQRLSSTQTKLPSTPSMWASGNARRRAAMPCPSPLPASRTRACAGSCTTEGSSLSASTGVGNRGASPPGPQGIQAQQQGKQGQPSPGRDGRQPKRQCQRQGQPRQDHNLAQEAPNVRLHPQRRHRTPQQCPPRARARVDDSQHEGPTYKPGKESGQGPNPTLCSDLPHPAVFQ